MNIRSIISRPLLILAILLVSSGCYTVLNHPAVETSSHEQEYASCYDCHSQAFFHDYRYRVVYPGIWDRYYIDPWWNNEILIYGEGGGAFRRSVISGRDFRTRESGEPGTIRAQGRRERIGTAPGVPGSTKVDKKTNVRRRDSGTTRSRSDKRKSSQNDRRRSSSGKKKTRKDKDRD